MKLIIAIIKPFKLDEVQEGLAHIGVDGMTTYDVRGFVIDFILKLKVEVAVADSKLEEALNVISRAAYTGKIGDGKIFVTPLNEAVRIRTGESGQAAL